MGIGHRSIMEQGGMLRTYLRRQALPNRYEARKKAANVCRPLRTTNGERGACVGEGRSGHEAGSQRRTGQRRRPWRSLRSESRGAGGANAGHTEHGKRARCGEQRLTRRLESSAHGTNAP